MLSNMMRGALNRGMNLTRPIIRGKASSHAVHHAPAKPVDLNIALEGVEAQWKTLVQEQKEAVMKKGRELMKQDWKTLTPQQKKSLYYIAFRSDVFPEAPTAQVIGGVLFLVVASYGLFQGLRSFTPPSPRTMTKEWKDAETAYVKKQNLNPLTGISSEGYKGKGMSGSLII